MTEETLEATIAFDARDLVEAWEDHGATIRGWAERALEEHGESWDRYKVGSSTTSTTSSRGS